MEAPARLRLGALWVCGCVFPSLILSLILSNLGLSSPLLLPPVLLPNALESVSISRAIPALFHRIDGGRSFFRLVFCFCLFLQFPSSDALGPAFPGKTCNFSSAVTRTRTHPGHGLRPPSKATLNRSSEETSLYAPITDASLGSFCLSFRRACVCVCVGYVGFANSTTCELDSKDSLTQPRQSALYFPMARVLGHAD